MTRVLSIVAFILGTVVVCWMASAFLNSHQLALLITLIIEAIFVIGFVELVRYQQASRALSAALTKQVAKVSVLDDWIGCVPASLQHSVRRRIDGIHSGLPAPVLAPYLIGLLVMLGLLGTFAGMVDTLKGAVMALEGTTELEAIRAGLAAPIKGLSMAFGTSVAGISASAMLGFISTMSRRERMQVSRLLDEKVNTAFQDLSHNYHRQQTYSALQLQAHTMPDMTAKLALLTEQLGRMGDNLSACLLDNQEKFHQSVTQSYTDLACSVDKALRQNLADCGRLAGEGMVPVVQEMVEEIKSGVDATHQQLLSTSEQQLLSMSSQLEATTARVADSWRTGVAAQEQANQSLADSLGANLNDFNRQFELGSAALLGSFERASEGWLASQRAADQTKVEQWSATLAKSAVALEQAVNSLVSDSQSASVQMVEKIGALLGSSEALVQERVKSEADWLAGHDQRMRELTSVLKKELTQLRDEEAARGEGAVEKLNELQVLASQQLAELGRGLEEPMRRLLETASETPKAAAEVIAKLRAEVSKNTERDNDLLQERKQTLEKINNLSEALTESSAGQREALEAMVTSSTSLLQTATCGFSELVESEAEKLSRVVDYFTVSAAELSSLGEVFNVGVKGFAEANSQLIDNLNRIEGALEKSGARSDEQLAYYVAQAREIIDHSMLSQQELLQQMRQLTATDLT